ncbi:MAG: hypothetical protein EAY65_04620 [Alphaproteobacteria bacterium]|nr:MAG: hypothetical protein EAY65_04620 [Alphaproteobacteria bacterium]
MKRPQRASSPKASSKASKKKSSARKQGGAFMLFVGDDGAILSYTEHKIVVRRLFSPEPHDKASETFRELLAQYPEAPIYLLGDVVDQSYVRHTLPPVSVLGVNKIIQRRLARDFSSEDLKGAISLGREKSGRKDWNFLLVSLSSKGVIGEWCAMLYELPNRFKGVYLAPVECELFAPIIAQGVANGTIKKEGGAPKKRSALRKPKKAPSDSKTANEATAPIVNHWEIIVLHNKTGGFRQVVLKNKKLVFTRMAQSHAHEKATVQAGHVEQEVKNTIEYLKRLSFNDTATLSIMIIVGDDLKPHISPLAFQASQVSLYTPYDIAEYTDLTQCVLSGDKFCDILLCSLFLKSQKHKLRLLPDYIKKVERFYNTLSAIRIGATLTMIALALGIGAIAYDALQIHQHLEDAQQKNRSMVSRLQEFQEKGKQLAEDPYKVDSLIKIEDMIHMPFPHYDDLFTALRPVVKDHITFAKVEWSLFGLGVDILDSAATAQPYRGGQVGASFAIDAVVSVELTPSAHNKEELLAQWQESLYELKKDTRYIFEQTMDASEKAEKDEININFEERASLNKQDLKAQDKTNISLKVRTNPSYQAPSTQLTPNAISTPDGLQGGGL